MKKYVNIMSEFVDDLCHILVILPPLRSYLCAAEQHLHMPGPPYLLSTLSLSSIPVHKIPQVIVAVQ